MSKRSKKKKNKGDGLRKLDRAILAFLKKKGGKGVRTNRLFSKFRKTHNKQQIEGALMRLEQQGQITYNRKGVVRSSHKEKGSSRDTIQGRVDMTASGSAYVITDAYENDVYIPRNRTGNALHNDIVEVRISRSRNAKPRGEIVGVVKRNQTEFIGTYHAKGDFGHVKELHTDHFPFDFFIPPGKEKGAKDNDVVLIVVTRWDSKGKNPEAEVRELLSGTSDNDLEMKAILLENGFNLVFPKEVIDESEAIPVAIPQEEIDNRLDCRNINTFTIDPADAKDFDDALSVQKLENRNYEIGVHIADVSHYVKPNTPLDKEAQYRATSVYLPDRVCPMLPEKLSNGLCSLRPNEDKLAFSVFFEIDEALKIKNYRFARTVINSDRRFTYEEAQEVIEGKSNEYKEEFDILKRMARSLRKKRFKEGAINFEMPEVRFTLDDKAHPIDLYVKERKEAHMLVEDFMLLANTTVARYVGSTARKMVYRVHDEPDMDRLKQLEQVASRFGHHLKFKNQGQARDVLNRLMEYLQGRSESFILQQLAVRSMAKAEYTTKNIGHYGLGADYYTHFTSPIRRYPDVLVHRILWEHMNKESASMTDEELEGLCEMCSVMERKAQLADRDATRYKQVEYLADRLGEEYEGVITGVIQRGFFVQMQSTHCEGFCPLDQFKGERFVFDEEKLELRGDRGHRFGFGGSVRVQLISAKPKERRVELAIVE